MPDGGESGMIKVPFELQTATGRATVYHNGAHITEFQPAGQRPVLFLSSKSNWVAGKAIRGGIPIIFPWFGAKSGDPKAPMHGLARTAFWKIERVSGVQPESTELIMTLRNNPQANHLWPFDISLRYIIRIGKKLDLELQTINRADKPFTFEEAFHTYLAVSDVREISAHGLRGKTYIDKTDQMKRKREEHDPLRIVGETDRVYLNTAETVTLEDPGWNRRISIAKENSSTTVVWNPWIEKTRTMSDLAPDDWRNFICIETANAAENAITVAPGQTHSMSASIWVS